VVLPETNFLVVIPATVPPLSNPAASDTIYSSGGAMPRRGRRSDRHVADGSFARLFRWQAGNLAVVETIPRPRITRCRTLCRQRHLFMALRSDGASAGSWTALAHYHRTGAVKGYTYVESLPPTKGGSAVARVMVFDRDPFGGNAIEWESFAIRGWAYAAEIQGGKVLAQFQPDVGLPGGLGESAMTTLVPRRALPASAVALANQWELDSSAFGKPPAQWRGRPLTARQPPRWSTQLRCADVAVFPPRLRRGRLRTGPRHTAEVEFWRHADDYAGHPHRPLLHWRTRSALGRIPPPGQRSQRPG
jgi:hypothetical protein